MTAKAGDNCLVCGGQSLEPLITIPDIPTLCNRLCASETEARNAPRGDISLNYCLDCGHIVNSSFDESRVKYDGHFENTLTFSPHFRRYADATADRLINRYGLTGKRIVEIGCGNGEFLHLLCNPGNRGEGYDPSQPTSRSMAGRGSLEIIGRKFSVEDARGADFVCCRQVLEHLPEPVDLLRRLYETMARKADAVVFFEVPNALYTLDRLGIWDVIYEHVSYFTPSSLLRAFRGAGFSVCCAETAFDDQYIWLEARVDREASPSASPRRPPNGLYTSFNARFAEKVEQWRRRVDQLKSERRHVVIWGGGAKGAMFLNLLRVSTGAGIDWVVDVNPRKHSHFIPLTGQKIVSPDWLLKAPPDLVVVMNPEYEREVRSMIGDMGISCEVVAST